MDSDEQSFYLLTLGWEGLFIGGLMETWVLLCLAKPEATFWQPKIYLIFMGHRNYANQFYTVFNFPKVRSKFYWHKPFFPTCPYHSIFSRINSKITWKSVTFLGSIRKLKFQGSCTLKFGETGKSRELQSEIKLPGAGDNETINC